MTPTQKRKHLELLKLIISDLGFIQDSYGNWKKEHDGREYRIKIKKVNISFEIKLPYGWSNIRSVPIVRFTLADMARFISIHLSDKTPVNVFSS